MKVFISHRASDGEAYASAIQRELELRKISAFLYQHHESEITQQNLRIEDFIYPEIEQADCLVLVLSPKIFDGADDPEDWVRLEIEKAQSLNKLIIPVKCQGFVYPDIYPCDSIKEIGKTRAVEWKTAYPKASIQGVINLLPTPTLKQRLQKIAKPIAQWSKSASASATAQAITAYNWLKERVFYNPTVRKWWGRLFVKPVLIFIPLALFFFVIPVFVFGRLDSASSGLRNQLADCYNWGILVKQDFAKANYYYRKSVEADSNAYAMAWVALHARDTLAYSNSTFSSFQLNNKYLDTLSYKARKSLSPNTDSLYRAITHLMKRSGDKGYVEAYYALARILCANSDLDLNERYDQALELLRIPNRYNNYDYKGLWENIVYRIEFQVSERWQSGPLITNEILNIYSDTNYKSRDIGIAKKYIANPKIPKNEEKRGVLQNAYYNVIENYLSTWNLDSALIMEYHPLVETYLHKFKHNHHKHLVNLINIDQINKAYKLAQYKIKHNPGRLDSLTYAYLLHEKGSHTKARKILHQVYNSEPSNALCLYLLAKSYTHDNDSLASAYFAQLFASTDYTPYDSSVNYNSDIDKEVPKFLTAAYRYGNWKNFHYNIRKYYLSDIKRYSSYYKLKQRHPEIDTAIYQGLCKLRQKAMVYAHTDSWNSKELIHTIDTLISRHVQPDRVVYEYEYLKFGGDDVDDYKYDKDKDILYRRSWLRTSNSEKIAHFYIATDKIRNLEPHCHQYFSKTIEEAIEDNDELYKYYYHWANTHRCDSLKHYITKSRSEHAVYLLEDYHEDDARIFEMQCIAKYGFN